MRPCLVGWEYPARHATITIPTTTMDSEHEGSQRRLPSLVQLCQRGKPILSLDFCI